MEVKTISIDWNNDFSNNALLVIHVNKLPQNLYVYEQKENIYFAVNENNGLVSFFYEDPKDHNGYDGEKLFSQKIGNLIINLNILLKEMII